MGFRPLAACGAPLKTILGGRAILPAAGFQPARPPKKAAAAKIGRPPSVYWTPGFLPPGTSGAHGNSLQLN
jgi:hypothetical protein